MMQTPSATVPCAPYPPSVSSGVIDACMAWVSLGGCIATTFFGCRVLQLYRAIRAPANVARATAEANAHVDNNWFQQRLRMLRCANNLRNDAIVFCIGTLIVWCFVHVYFFVAMLLRYYDAASARDPSIAWNKFYYTIDECRVSALGDQYVTTACCMLAIMYTYGLTFRPFRHTGLFWNTQLVSIVATVALWYGSLLDEKANTAYIFFAGMPWCWFADGGGVGYNVIKFTTAYAFYLAIWVFGALALWSLRRRLYARQRARQTIDARLAPQITVFMMIFACGGVMRFVIPHLSGNVHSVAEGVFSIFFVTAYTFHGALTSLAWAYGEGLHWALLMPWRYSVMNLDVYTDPFSSIASQVLNDNASNANSTSGLDELLHEPSDDSRTPTAHVSSCPVFVARHVASTRTSLGPVNEHYEGEPSDSM